MDIRKSFFPLNWGAWHFFGGTSEELVKFSLRNLIFHKFMIIFSAKVFCYPILTSHDSYTVT